MRDAPGRAALDAFAFLLMPAEPFTKGSIVRADRSWEPSSVSSFTDADVVVWGRSWMLSGNSVAARLRFAAERERALLRLRRHPPGAFNVVAIHRLAPPTLEMGAPRGRLRQLLLCGALVEMTRGAPVSRVIDAAAQSAGIPGRVMEFRRGSGAAALARLRRPDGAWVMLRVARAGSHGDPTSASDALKHLESHAVGEVPRLLDRGHAAGASWSSESLIEGHMPRRVDARLAQQIVGSVARWPVSGTSPRAPVEDLGRIADHFPHWRRQTEAAALALTEPLSGLRGVTRHGDLWAGNVLVRGTRLAGILDWDAWHPSGAPGADLVYLFVTEAWRRTRRTLGELWAQRLWHSPDFTALTRSYWDALGIEADQQTLDAVGLSAWAAHVATSVTRLPELATNERWLANNARRLMTCVEQWTQRS